MKMNTATEQPLPDRLGGNPLPKCLLYWGFGILWCIGALKLNRIDDIWGPIAMGLATFVNFFCFIQGLNHLKRAFRRTMTLWKVRSHGLTPAIVRTQGGYVVIDPVKGYLVNNGAVADFRRIRRIVCRSNWLANKIEIYGCTRLPIIEGFRTREDLFAASDALLDAVRASGGDPQYDLIDLLRRDATEKAGKRTTEEEH